MTLKPSGVDSPQQNGDYNSYNETEPTILEWIKSIKPSGSEIIDYVVSLFPFSTWITSYNLQWFAGDLVAGSFILIHWRGCFANTLHRRNRWSSGDSSRHGICKACSAACPIWPLFIFHGSTCILDIWNIKGYQHRS